MNFPLFPQDCTDALGFYDCGDSIYEQCRQLQSICDAKGHMIMMQEVRHDKPERLPQHKLVRVSVFQLISSNLKEESYYRSTQLCRYSYCTAPVGISNHKALRFVAIIYPIKVIRIHSPGLSDSPDAGCYSGTWLAVYVTCTVWCDKMMLRMLDFLQWS